MGFLEPGDEDDEIVEGAGAPKRRRSQRIDDIICDLEQSSRVDQTVKTMNIPNIDCFLRGKVTSTKERFNQLDNIPNSNYNSSLLKKQPAKISADCDWSRKWANGDRIRCARKRKGEILTSTKTKKLRCALSIIQ